MTAFELFAAAWWLLLGVLLTAIAITIIYAVIAGIRNHLYQKRKEYGVKIRNYRGRD